MEIKNQLKKRFVVIITVLSSIVLVAGILFFYRPIMISGILIPKASYKSINRDFMEYQYDINIINEYLINLDVEQVCIYEIEDIKGSNIEAQHAFSVLKRIGYKMVEKDNNAINYLRSSSLNEGRGLVYSIDGSEPQLQFLTRIEPLSENGWYYYEENFNEWERRNR